jgi:hypothetical protein
VKADRKIDEVLREAREARTGGQKEAALQGYINAAILARSKGESGLLAHALRHVSDLSRERGAKAQALAAAVEAVKIYRSLPDRHTLDLANALRLNALALEGANKTTIVTQLWKEARSLYSAIPVSAAVEECDRHLAGP